VATWDGSLADRVENDILKLITGQGTSSGPFGTIAAGQTSGWGLALHKAHPTDDNTAGAELTTGGSTNYLRIPSDGKWAVPTDGSVISSAACRWPSGAGTAGNNWETIVGVGLWTSTTVGGGSFVAYNPLFMSVATLSGSFFVINIGGLAFSIGGAPIT